MLNLENKEELIDVTPAGFVSLNSQPGGVQAHGPGSGK
jgi:hypothetical protein